MDGSPDLPSHLGAPNDLWTLVCRQSATRYFVDTLARSGVAVRRSRRCLSQNLSSYDWPNPPYVINA